MCLVETNNGRKVKITSYIPPQSPSSPSSLGAGFGDFEPPEDGELEYELLDEGKGLTVWEEAEIMQFLDEIGVTSPLDFDNLD